LLVNFQKEKQTVRKTQIFCITSNLNKNAIHYNTWATANAETCNYNAKIANI